MTSSGAWPRKLFLIGRMSLTLKSYLGSSIGSRFYNETFLEGVCKQRIEVRKQLSKSAAWCFGLTTILAFFHLLPGKISVFGNSVEVTKDLIPILGAMTAMSLLGMFLKIADDLIIDRYINIIFEHVKIYSPKLIVMNHVSVDLWAEAITPNYFGPKSGVGYLSYFLFMAIQVLILFIMFLIYPTAFIIISLIQIYDITDQLSFSNLNLENSGYYLLFAFILLVLVLTYTLLLALSCRYKFLRPDFDEVTSEPTSEFLKELGSKNS